MRSIFIAIFSFLLLSSCLDEIKLEIPKGVESSIVIRGELIKGTPSTLVVYISRVFNFDLSSLSPLNARSVILVDQDGNEITVPSTQDGVHKYTFDLASDPIKVDFGQSYKLLVSTFDGRTFESSLEEILELPAEKGTLKSERSTIEFLDQDNVLRAVDIAQIFLDAPLQLKDQQENARLLWTVERTFKVSDNASRLCYVTGTIDFNNIHLLDGTTIGEDRVQDFPLSQVRLNYELGEGYYYSIYQKSLTKGAFDHWNQTKQIIERTGGLFDAPAGRVISNFINKENESDEVFGYFAAFAQDTIRLYISPEEYETAGRFCPPPVPAPPGGGCAVPLCCDCTIQEGSQTQRPDFWIE